MKKTMILAAVAAMFMFASCQKEEVLPGQNSQSEELVFTATIDQNSSKTTINTTDGKIKWDKGDEITITDAESTSAVYIAQSGGSTTTTFKIKSGETALGDGPYSATYGTAPSTSQAYADYYSAANTAKDLYMTASSTGTTLTFKAACGLLKLTLTSTDASDKSISEIKVFGEVNSSNVIYTLTCNSAQDISSAKDFYIALPAGDYSVFKFTNSTGHICYKTAQSAMAIANNDIQPVTLTGIVFNDMLPGKFTVNSSSGQVRFSRGNLYWDGSAFKLEENQPDYPATWDDNHIGLFYFSKTASIAYDKSYQDDSRSIEDLLFTNDYNSSTKPNADFTVNGQTGVWRSLNAFEWPYIFSSQTCGFATVAGKTGIIILPNTFTDPKTNTSSTATEGAFVPSSTTGYTSNVYTSGENWEAMESAGAVFLPAAGHRTAPTTIEGVGTIGEYWSSSAVYYSGYESHAYDQYFNSSNVARQMVSRYNGRSIRLVCSAE